MKKRFIIYFAVFLVISFYVQIYAATQSAEELFQDAKILIFDKKWKAAQNILEEILEQHPKSSAASSALFYKAMCLENQAGKERIALQVYKDYLGTDKKTESLAQESELSIIKLALKLYETGKSSYLDEIEKRLYRDNRVVKYFAAIKLSSVKDKEKARKGLPVLQDILKKEKDEGLRDRAKIAILKIDPESFRDFQEEGYERKARMLMIRVYSKWKREPLFSLNIPWAFADLALRAIPRKEREELRAEGYDLDKMVDELIHGRNIIEIDLKNSIFKIWIDY